MNAPKILAPPPPPLRNDHKFKEKKLCFVQENVWKSSGLFARVKGNLLASVMTLRNTAYKQEKVAKQDMAPSTPRYSAFPQWDDFAVRLAVFDAFVGFPGSKHLNVVCSIDSTWLSGGNGRLVEKFQLFCVCGNLQALY